MRLFAISDIHVDYAHNMAWVEGLSNLDYAADTLLLAGDVSHDLDKLSRALEALARKFRNVFFVPGNHDLWLIRTSYRDSIEKFHDLLDHCTRIGVSSRPERIETDSGAVWVVPLFSWYKMPEEGEESLFLPKPGEDPDLDVWSDNHFTQWTSLPEGQPPADYFLALNHSAVARGYDAPVVSFSHFLPRTDLILNTPEEGPIDDPLPSFNFSRVAGTKALERQIRHLRSRVHVYGHQHRNRDRTVGGVRYVSHCLGYRVEREKGLVRGDVDQPMEIRL